MTGGASDANPEARGSEIELTFGECEGLCGGMVERIGWDRYCYACQDEMRLEDEEAREALADEDDYLYSVPWSSPDVADAKEET